MIRASMSTAPTPKPPIDWVRIEADYRAGIKPLRLIAEENGVSHPAIRKRATRDQWSRDLTSRIQAKADELVSKAMVPKVGSQTRHLETEIINTNAKAIYDVRIGHRKLAGRAINLTTIMMGDLEAVSSPEGQGLVETLIDSLSTPADGTETPEQAARRKASNRKVLDRALSLDSRVDTAKKLADTVRILVDVERQAFGITDATGNPDDPAGAKSLNEAERASRLARLFQAAAERQRVAVTDVEVKSAS